MATTLVNSADTEELALTLNGRKKKLKATNFSRRRNGRASPRKYSRVKPAWHRFIDNSFLSSELRQEYHTLLERRFAQLGLLSPNHRSPIIGSWGRPSRAAQHLSQQKARGFLLIPS